MKIRVYRALARGVILESVRRKDLWVVAILGLLIMAAAGALGFFGFEGLEAFAKDLSVTVIGLFSTIIAIIVSTRQLPDEIKNRTLYPLLARPITRLDLLIGKLLGAIFVSWLSFVILATLTSLALLSFGVGLDAIMLQYVFVKMMGLALLCTVGLTLSLSMTPAAAATLGFVLAFGSGMIVRAMAMSSASTPQFIPAFKIISWALPQYSLFDLGGRVANQNWPMVPLWAVGALMLYALLYGSAAVTLGWTKFRSRAL